MLFSEDHRICGGTRCDGSAFHAAGPSCEKARSARLVCNRGSEKSDVDEDQRPRPGRPQSTGLVVLDVCTVDQ